MSDETSKVLETLEVMTKMFFFKPLRFGKP